MDKKVVKERLLRLRGGFLKKIERLGKELREMEPLVRMDSINDEVFEGASDRTERNFNAALSDARFSTLESIEKALARLENGTYGICQNCGDTISDARLEALSFASDCIKCAKSKEV